MQIQTQKNTHITSKAHQFLKNTTSTTPSRLHRFKAKVKWSNNVSPIHHKPSTMLLLQKQNIHPAKQLENIIKKSQQLFHQERIKQKIKQKVKNITKTEKEKKQEQQSKYQIQSKKSQINYLKNIYFEFVNQQLKNKASARKYGDEYQHSFKIAYECPGTPAKIHPRPLSAKKDFVILTPKNSQFRRLSQSKYGYRSHTLTPNQENNHQKSVSSYRDRRSSRLKKDKQKQNKPVSAKSKITKIPFQRVFLGDLEPWQFSNEQI